MKRIILILGFLLIANNTQAAGMTGAQLLGYCSSKDEVFQGICLGYITGYLDLNNLIQDPRVYPWKDGDKNILPKTCLPTNVTAGQVKTNLVNYYLLLNPEIRDQYLKSTAVGLMSHSIRSNWPCKEEK